MSIIATAGSDWVSMYVQVDAFRPAYGSCGSYGSCVSCVSCVS